MNLDHFNELDKEILECILCVANTITKKSLDNKDPLP